MTPEQQTLLNLLTSRGLNEQVQQAVAGDATAMAAVLADLQSYSVTAEPRLCYAVESGEAATAAGGDHTTLLAALLGDPNGIMLFQKLSSSAGVMWSHEVTIPYLAWLVSQDKMSAEVRDALIQLSAPTTYPWADLTANQVQSAFLEQIKADYLKTQLATMQAVIDPVQTKLNAIATWGQTADVLALSVVEYQGYIDGLMATADGNPV